MKCFGLIGYPLGHSFSKKYFTEKFERAGIADSHQYHLFPIQEISELPALLRETAGLVGLNVTIPHKQAVIPFLTELDETASRVGAVNVIHIQGTHWKGYNTDVIGFEEALEQWFLQQKLLSFSDAGNWFFPKGMIAYILGTGGASKAVQYVLTKRQIPFYIVSRQPAQGSSHLAYEQVPLEMPDDYYRLWINTTPAGTYPDIEHIPPLPVEVLNERDLVYDLIYNPEKTRLMQEAARRGAAVLNGLPMLHGQAEAAWKIWNSGLP
jgi:shikimate dehydrogenase